MIDQWALHSDDRSMPGQRTMTRHSINELDNRSLIDQWCALTGQQCAMTGDVDVGGQ